MITIKHTVSISFVHSAAYTLPLLYMYMNAFIICNCPLYRGLLMTYMSVIGPAAML